MHNCLSRKVLKKFCDIEHAIVDFQGCTTVLELKLDLIFLQVESQKQSRTQERPCLMSMDVEGADFTFDKNEQPSPISVLESPFKEESLGALESKEITNDLQGQ